MSALACIRFLNRDSQVDLGETGNPKKPGGLSGMRAYTCATRKNV